LAKRILPGQLGINPKNMDSAMNGHEAVEAVKKAIDENKPYDLILMDESMPVKDGVTATAEIRQLEGEKAVIRSVSIVANSNSEPVETQKKFMAAGATEYCFKDQLDTAYIQRLFQALKSVASKLEAQEAKLKAQ